VQLSNGCLCCNVRSDLTLTLSDMAARRAQGTLPPFERVVIETSGLADPAPILHALMTDRDLQGIYALDGVITTVDAILGIATLAQYEESRRQAAVADRIVLTKTDLDGAQADALKKRLALINPGASIVDAARDVVTPSLLFDCGFYEVGRRHADVSEWLAHDAAGANQYHRHTGDIGSISLVREAPLHAVTLTLLLSALAENCGADLLRMKGIVNVREDPEYPAVIHGVQHVYHAPVWLSRWPSADHRTRMVFIGRGLSERWIRSLLTLLEAEVAAETARRTTAVVQ
jgi:G3E family GTPase